MCLCRNDIREIASNTKKCQWFEDHGPASSARAQCCHGYSFVGHPSFSPESSDEIRRGLGHSSPSRTNGRPVGSRLMPANTH